MVSFYFDLLMLIFNDNLVDIHLGVQRFIAVREIVVSKLLFVFLFLFYPIKNSLLEMYIPLQIHKI